MEIEEEKFLFKMKVEETEESGGGEMKVWDEE
jgi:hypothetical protein